MSKATKGCIKDIKVTTKEAIRAMGEQMTNVTTRIKEVFHVETAVLEKSAQRQVTQLEEDDSKIQSKIQYRNEIEQKIIELDFQPISSGFINEAKGFLAQNRDNRSTREQIWENH